MINMKSKILQMFVLMMKIKSKIFLKAILWS